MYPNLVLEGYVLPCNMGTFARVIVFRIFLTISTLSRKVRISVSWLFKNSYCQQFGDGKRLVGIGANRNSGWRQFDWELGRAGNRSGSSGEGSRVLSCFFRL